MDYQEFLQFVLPCNHPVLRCAVTQRRPTRTIDEIRQYDQRQFLDVTVESTLCQLIYAEVSYHLEIQAYKDKLVHTHDFTMQKAFKAVDDWNYGYIDQSNLKRFLINMGYIKVSNKKGKAHEKYRQLVLAILRRFDLNGDGKVSLMEFKQGI